MDTKPRVALRSSLAFGWALALAIAPAFAAGQARQLSEDDMARIRQRMASDKVVRADQAKAAELRRQEDERRRAEEERIAQMEAEAQAEWEAMQEPVQSGGGFAEALLHGMNVLQEEMAKHEYERAQQEAFLDDVRRQAEAVAWQREREIERERQRVAEERARREQAAAQQRQALVARSAASGASSAPAAAHAQAQGQAKAPDPALAREQALREQAAAERERQRTLQAEQQAAAQATAKAEAERKRKEDEAARQREADARKLAEQQARQQKEQAWRDYLAAHKRGIRLGAKSCDGKDRPYRLVGDRPSNPLPATISHYSSCISVQYEARCPGTQRGQGLRGNQYNFTGMGLGCLSAESPLPGQLGCPAEQVQVELLDVTACS